MRRGLVITLGAAMFATPLVVLAQQARPAAAYKAPRNAFGQPDLGGYWTNATLTAQARPLVMNGTLSRDAARTAAEAAGECLKLLK